ncbi:MAG TPA: M67 family metallopeptidase [Terriglobales bacterium]|nr:M67 family metallopeptidase [Terriglobales bacterium]
MIRMREQHINQIRGLGEDEYPYECCGLLLGHFEEDGRKSLVELFPISNAREEEARRRRFLIEPGELLRGERHARERQLDVIGFYHSHPEDSGVPSQYDLDHAWPVYSYVIVSVHSGKAVNVFSWEMQEDRSRFNPEEIVREKLAKEN